MRLLHVDASPKGDLSTSRALSRFFVDRMAEGLPGLDVDRLDLAEETPAHVTADFAAATYTPVKDRTDAMHATLAPSDALCERLIAAEFLVFAMPMYNFSMPSSFKAFVDAIVRTGLTYDVDATGRYSGLLGAKRVVFITTRGADLAAGSPLSGMDALTPALKASFGFMGVGDPIFVDAQPVQFADPDVRAEAINRARDDLSVLASRWTKPSR
jgi:FMN-dependent NADH-azoreductase